MLGFIGLCGVLQSQTETAVPRWLEILAGILVLVALVLACLSTAMVATVAWPLSRVPAPGAPGDDGGVIHRDIARLRRGVGLTFVAVAVLAVAATSSWWPSEAGSDGLVEVSAGSGQVVCGEIEEAEPGVLAVISGGERVAIRMSDVAAVRVVDSCS